MSESQPISLPLAPLRDLVAWWRVEQVPGMVIGAVAVAVLGRPRATRDVDSLVLLDEDRWESFLTAGSRFGFLPRVSDPLAFAHEARVLLLRHAPSGVDVDISLGALPFEKEAMARAKDTVIEELKLLLPTPEDLIVMKAVAHRPHDLADIEGLLDAHPKLNLRRIRRWVGEFASVLEMPELLADLEKLLAFQRKRKKGRRRTK